jgi:hypothetical protein
MTTWNILKIIWSRPNTRYHFGTGMNQIAKICKRFISEYSVSTRKCKPATSRIWNGSASTHEQFPASIDVSEIKVMQRDNSTVLLKMVCKIKVLTVCLSKFKPFSFCRNLKTALGKYRFCRCHLHLLLDISKWSPSNIQSPIWLSPTFSDPS